jgi:HTH-type transcriptional regulator/antitoxin HigA
MIETREEFDHTVAMMEALDRRAESGEARSREEETLLALLEQLVTDFDDQVELPSVEPCKTIQFLMEQRGLRQADLLTVFGSRSVASDVVSGKREPSKAHVRKLAAFFRVSTDLFL